MKKKILIEASGGLTAGYLIKCIQASGYKCVASDINNDSLGKLLADEFVIVPKSKDKILWKKIETIINKLKIDIIIPSLDETLVEWSRRKSYFENKYKVHIIISDIKTINICNDKWLTYKFFKEIGIPTPNTSLEQKFKLIKPRQGRGSKNIMITKEAINMKKMISQELLKGKEVTIDIFCDVNNSPIYIIPRERTLVIDGKSVDGKVIKNSLITKYVKIICKNLKFVGPINMQCFILQNKSIKFFEINPRIGGGMALGFAASENWIPLIQKNLINKNKIVPKKIQYGLNMKRFYVEKFV